MDNNRFECVKTETVYEEMRTLSPSITIKTSMSLMVLRDKQTGVLYLRDRLQVGNNEYGGGLTIMLDACGRPCTGTVCPECQMFLPDGVVACPECGCPIEKEIQV